MQRMVFLELIEQPSVGRFVCRRNGGVYPAGKPGARPFGTGARR
jgi:hypothetical protein